MIEYLLIIASIVLCFYFNSIILYVFIILFIGTRQYALYSLLHESLHYSISRNKQFNDTIAIFFLALPLFTRLKVMRSKHLLHHQHLKSNLDPEEKMLQYKAFQFPKNFMPILLLVIADLSGVQFLFVFLKQLSKKPMKEVFSILIIIVSIGLILYYLNILYYFIIFWIIPYCTVYQLLNRIRLATEHYHITNQKYSTRSIHCNFLESIIFSPYYIGYHAEHHLYPSVPFYNLPKLSKMLKSNNIDIYTENSYIVAIKNLISSK